MGAGKEKLCAAGNGAKFSNHQLVVIDRIVVEDIVFLKLPRVPDKVVVHGIFPHLDAGVSDHIFQVDRLSVLGAGVDFFGVHGFSFFL